MVEEWRTGDLAYTRGQAKVWHILVKELGRPPDKRLAPACSICAAPEEMLSYNPAELSYICRNCKMKSSAIHLSNGRIVDI